MSDPTDRDPADPTPEERRETAAAEGLAAGEQETDPAYAEDADERGAPGDAADARPEDPSVEDEAPPQD